MYDSRQYLDRETENHFHTQHSRGTYYGIALRTENTDIARKIERELRKKGKFDTVGHIDDIVFLSGPIPDKILSEIKEYISSREGIRKAKIVTGEYEHFVGNPAYWIRDYAKMKIKHGLKI